MKEGALALQFILAASLAAFAPGTLFCAAGEVDWIAAELAKPVLGADAGRSSWRAVSEEVERADAACDAAWRRMKTREELQRHGKDLRSRMIRSMGGFPSERCPLNARTVSVRKRDGYTVENVLFESWPGVHVSANLYLPDSTRFPPPHPGVLIVCGHSGAGKSAPNYSRGGVMSSRTGIAALVVDPLAQGERVQERGKDPAANWDEHNRIGSLAVLLGGGFPRFRVWDAMRALDYLETRPDIDAKAFGCMGNSGGGNVTAFLQAVDPRLAATAPAGYICSFSRAAEKSTIGPGDACQNIFGQLSFGLNHASLCLMSAPLPVRVQAYRGDLVFPFEGTRHTVELVEDVMERLGWGERFGMTDMEGGHLWYEGSRASSIDWMKRWLCGDAAALRRTTAESRALGNGCSSKTADCGPGEPEGFSCGGGGVLSLPGERTVYDVMRDELKVAVAARRGVVQPADVRRIAGIAEPGAMPLRRIEISDETHGDLRIVREAYVRPDGLKLPAAVFIPDKPSGAPVIALDATSRRNSATAVAKYVASGRPVMSIDLTGTGEIGLYGRKKGGGYYGRKGRDEELSVLLYALGQSLVGRQATELQEVALELKRRFGASPDVFAHGRMAVAAAHAFAVNRGLFGSVEFVAPPPSWSESVRKALDTPMSICVNGALLSYDWTELVSKEQGQ